jgi:Zn-dependent protease with chaperone function
MAYGAPLASPWQTLLLSFASLLVSVAFLVLIATVIAVVAWTLVSLFTTVPEPDRQWPRLTAWALVAIPLVALALAFLLSQGGEGRTFYAQKSANRRRSVLLLVVLIGLFVVVGEVIAASLTFDSYWALIGAALAGVIGGGAALFAQMSGTETVLASAGAVRVNPAEATGAPPVGQLADVVRELSIAANVAPPALYLIDDPAPNAMAVGTKPSNSAIAVTRGLLESFDREQLQGVIGGAPCVRADRGADRPGVSQPPARVPGRRDFGRADAQSGWPGAGVGCSA